MRKYVFFIVFALAAFGLPVALSAAPKVTIEKNKGRMIKLSKPAASVVIADPSTADIQVVSPKTVFVYGKKIGETSLSAVDTNDDVIYHSVVSITHNLSSLKQAIRKVAPDARIDLETVDGGIVVKGSAVSVNESEKINDIVSAFVGEKDKVVNIVTTGGGDQVTLQVKIVEMARSDLKNLGINLQASVSSGGLVSQIINGAVDPTALVSRSTSGNTNILGGLTRGNFSVNGLIDALETQGIATVLAEPSLTTSTGKAASFLAGGRYPIPVAGEDGTITVQYQPFGVSLSFTPVVMSNDRISVLVNPEVSTLNFSNPIQISGFTYPILDTRNAQATVELGSGQTFVLAGLLRNDTSNNISKFPGVGDVPVLGALFRSQRFQSNQTELVILVTPYVVHPVSDPSKIQTPVDGFKPPTDNERLLFGSLYQQQKMPEIESVSGKEVVLHSDGDKHSIIKLNGKGGFILE